MPGVEFDSKTSIFRKGIEPTQVKSIKLLTDLDDGSANNKSTTIVEKSGIVFGNTHKFAIESYTNQDPKDESVIKWAVSYTDSETGQYYQNTLEDIVTGDTVSITFSNKNMCGNNLKVKAYINDIDNEGGLALFKHNRFRFFDRQILIDDVNKRKNDAWLINQDDTNTCGPSAIMYAFAKKDKEAYSKFILDLHRKGYAKHNNYIIDISSDGDLHDIADTILQLKITFLKVWLLVIGFLISV
ncbi:hypothetical protein [Chryseobacterium sp. Leaf394]|uniref:hypothetical protein n=1 Tax=Chryseobacterium sp. Leaf394 TaxID=1736361 RepID=UPI0006F47CC4|nr:hypothetical protein [Chryseobacterium sp. Leaf394]KQS89914.1 hypothetical protein ASG21_13120 [Chryseobacterium sp. Leaf394]